MPGRGTPHAGIRIDPALWEHFRELAEAAGTDRSTVVRELIRWYVREPGAKLPDRPARRDG